MSDDDKFFLAAALGFIVIARLLHRLWRTHYSDYRWFGLMAPACVLFAAGLAFWVLT